MEENNFSFRGNESGNGVLKTILFTHDDLDGCGCHLLYLLSVYTMGVSEYRVVNCTNGSIDDDVRNIIDSGILGRDTVITFADIVCSRELLIELMEKFGNVWVFDHHPTNYFCEHVDGIKSYIIPANKTGVMESGTSVFYHKLIASAFNTDDSSNVYPLSNPELFKSLTLETILPDFVDAVRSYDTYEWKEIGNIKAKELNHLYYLLGIKRFIQVYLNRIRGYDKDKLLIRKCDQLFVDYAIEKEQNAINTFNESDFAATFSIKLSDEKCEKEWYKCGLALNCKGANVSELASQFLTNNNEYDIFISFSLATGTYQFRTIRDDIDVGKLVALPMGGGGHPKAAGCNIGDDIKTIVGYLLANFAKHGIELIA